MDPGRASGRIAGAELAAVAAAWELGVTGALVPSRPTEPGDSTGAAVGRSIVAPAGLLPDRLTILRTAFDAMLKDPELLAEIGRTGLEFASGSGEQLQELIRDTVGASTDVVERTKTILRQ